MIEKITELLVHYSVPPSIASPAGYVLALGSVVLVSFVVDFLTRRVLLRVISALAKRSKTTFDDAVISNKVPEKFAHIAPAIVFYLSSETLFSDHKLIALVMERGSLAYIIFFSALTITSFIDALTDLSRSFSSIRDKPVKSYAQVVKLLIFIVTIILVISTIIDRSPWVLLSGLGAMTAVLMLVFKDSILGLVASVQISAYDMVRVGDWIGFPKYGADGDVVDISLTLVTIQNWDKTYTTIPTYAFISDSFKNWRGMSKAGGRRIKRALFIDLHSVRFLDESLFLHLSKVELLKDYLAEKKQELDRQNADLQGDLSHPVNGRRLTNLGTFRAYVNAYVRNIPKIHKDMTILVRQLPATPTGIPLEIYAFSRDTTWAVYEGITADIFDHLFAVITEFGLRVYQNPSGTDIDRALREKRVEGLLSS